MDSGVVDGKGGRQLVQGLAPVMAQYGLGAAGMAGVVAARVEGDDFVRGQGKGARMPQE